MSFRFILFLVALPFLFSGCYSSPDLPDVPAIQFERVEYKKAGGASNVDSLIVFVYFEDGKGDLGLSPIENAPPYNELFLLTYEDGTPIKISDPDPPIALPPFNCQDYIIQEVDTSQFDTLLVQRNPNHYNFEIDFYVNDGSGNFELFDFIDLVPNRCGQNYYGRFPPLNTDGRDRPLTGVIRYRMQSIAGFDTFFGNDQIQLQVRIRDRQNQLSETAISPPFTLQSVRVD